MTGHEDFLFNFFKCAALCLFCLNVYSLESLFPVRRFVSSGSFTNMMLFSYAAMFFVLFCVHALKMIVHVEEMCVCGFHVQNGREDQKVMAHHGL